MGAVRVEEWRLVQEIEFLASAHKHIIYLKVLNYLNSHWWEMRMDSSMQIDRDSFVIYFDVVVLKMMTESVTSCKHGDRKMIE